MYIKICLLPLVVQKIQVKITVGHNLTTIKMAKIKRHEIPTLDNNMSHSHVLWREYKMVQSLLETFLTGFHKET